MCATNGIRRALSVLAALQPLSAEGSSCASGGRNRPIRRGPDDINATRGARRVAGGPWGRRRYGYPSESKRQSAEGQVATRHMSWGSRAARRRMAAHALPISCSRPPYAIAPDSLIQRMMWWWRPLIAPSGRPMRTW